MSTQTNINTALDSICAAFAIVNANNNIYNTESINNAQLNTSGLEFQHPDLTTFTVDLLLNDTITSGLTATPGVPVLSVDISAGEWRISNILFTNAAPVNFAVPATGADPRIDAIFADNLGNLNYTTGIAAPTPVPPNTPANNVIVTYILVKDNALVNADYNLYTVDEFFGILRSDLLMINDTNPTPIPIISQKNLLLNQGGFLYWNGALLSMGTPVNSGTTVGSMLIWDGVSWVEETDILYDSGTKTLNLINDFNLDYTSGANTIRLQTNVSAAVLSMMSTDTVNFDNRISLNDGFNNLLIQSNDSVNNFDAKIYLNGNSMTHFVTDNGSIIAQTIYDVNAGGDIFETVTDGSTNIILSRSVSSSNVSLSISGPTFSNNITLDNSTGYNSFSSSKGNYLSSGLRLNVSIPAELSYPYTTKVTDYIICVRTLVTPKTVNLLAAPEAGRVYIIKDQDGNAAVNNITIVPAAGTIDGAATYTIAANYASVQLVYNGTEWSIY